VLILHLNVKKNFTLLIYQKIKRESDSFKILYTGYLLYILKIKR
jgi:hypothetical protein